MRKLIAALLILLLSVYAALWLHRLGGLVIISLGEWTLQTSVLLFVLIVVAGLALLYALLTVLRSLIGIPHRVRRWQVRRRENRARAHLVGGLLRLAEGRSNDAEKLLLKDADRSDAPLLHYLGAAIAAQHARAYEQRDTYLALADKTNARAGLAVGLIQAQLQIESRQWERALATLNYLNETTPNQPRVLAMLLRACEALDEWEHIDSLLPAARKQQVIDEAGLRRLERAAALHRLTQASRRSAGALEVAWNSLAKPLRQDPELLRIYVDGLAKHGRADDAEPLLRAQLNRDYDAELVQRYGALEVSAPDKALAQVEKWLQDRPEDPALLQAAGRLALKARIWGRARSYLEAAAARRPDALSDYLLGALLEHMGDADAARTRYREALEHTAVPRLQLSDAEQRALAQVRTG